jgi:hypothetical protein
MLMQMETDTVAGYMCEQFNIQLQQQHAGSMAATMPYFGFCDVALVTVNTAAGVRHMLMVSC